MNAELVAAIMIGFLGSSHCIVMCGGIVAALQLALPERSFSWKLAMQLLLSMGRLTTYTLLGALVGYFGAQAMALAGISLIWLRLLAGILLLLMALYIARLWFALTALERAGRHIWALVKPLSQKVMPLDSLPKAYLYGLCWGWLPCGLVYSTLGWSLASGSASQGALIMLSFGIGTLPALLAFGSMASQLSKFKNKPMVRYSAAGLLAIYGLYTIYLALKRLVF
ncbi:sulfite exporter TauE/SafE family protein [Arsukibacterium sp. UBA3155]|uniref:sulfite exporter TauE/SafE family protein n=1 Tax=Arsukibacterium sp. UBA3155 TaxID=1946058 RepID=UPI0025C47129|nr:sulfite exporter TauE/SafE family protein [Arsukibacterium sp. UBA3155]|tara:strand:+ start:34620 stop:35294 length:675 start_codon:yes stop_codon:yes gene_type:complete